MDYQIPPSNPSDPNLQALENPRPVVENHNLESRRSHIPGSTVEDFNVASFRQGFYDRAKPEDAEALKKLCEAAKPPVRLVQDCFLEVEPSQIPEQQQCFFTNKFCILSKDTLLLKSGSWRRHRREWGWYIHSNGMIGIKRTFGFHTINEHDKDIKTNWIMNVYAMIHNYDITTCVYLCDVFQSNNYDPCPSARLPLCANLVEAMVKKDLWDENCEPNIAGPSSRVARCKRRKDDDHELPGPSNAWESLTVAKAWSSLTERKGDGQSWNINELLGQSTPRYIPGSSNAWNSFTVANAWSSPTEPKADSPSRGINKLPIQSTPQYNFTEVKACNGPAGEVLALSICNCCGMVYRSSSGATTLNRHMAACKNARKTTPSVSK